MNDERPIEKLLRRYAKKRREAAGAPVELHPATRRLLHGEVAREYRNAAPEDTRASFAQMMQGWFPQLAWAVPLFVLVAVGLWSLLDRPESKQLALGPKLNETTLANESRAAKAQRREPESLALTLDTRRSIAGETAPTDFGAAKAVSPSPAVIPVRTPNPPVVSLDSAAEQRKASVRNGYQETAPANQLGVASSAAPAQARFGQLSSANRVTPLPAVPTMDSDAILQTNRSITGAYSAKTPQSATHLQNAPRTAATLARSDKFERNEAQTYSQSFANLAPETLKQKTATAVAPTPIPPVLANFRVEQTGRQLRVVDSDGSTYVGESDAAPEIWGGGGAKKDQAVQSFQRDGKISQLPLAASASARPVQSNFYRVTGTNRTLNQAVEFTWSFVALTNAPVVTLAEKIGAARTQDAKKLPTQFPVQLQNSSITGRVQFGTGKAIEINAVPVTP